MKRAPSILISGNTHGRGVEFDDPALDLSMQYPLALRAAGGFPWLLPCVPERAFVAEAVASCDGVLLTGGDDVNPDLYQDHLTPALEKTVHRAAPERDTFELLLIDEVFRQQKPLLAICRGVQLLNVALGGTLVVDIRRQVAGALNHSRSDRKDEPVHQAALARGSLLARIAGKTRLHINSSHHQAVGLIAQPLRATAVTNDGIIEGLELVPGAARMLPYLLGVQFHPERLFHRHAQHLDLFKSFTRACRRYR